MAERAADSENFVLVSSVRQGLKREFAFAFKSHSEYFGSIGRTRSTRSQKDSNNNDDADKPVKIGISDENLMESKEKPQLVSPKYGLELKMFPRKLKELLQTGLLEGLPVMYLRGSRVNFRSCFLTLIYNFGLVLVFSVATIYDSGAYFTRFL